MFRESTALAAFFCDSACAAYVWCASATRLQNTTITALYGGVCFFRRIGGWYPPVFILQLYISAYYNTAPAAPRARPRARPFQGLARPPLALKMQAAKALTAFRALGSVFGRYTAGISQEGFADVSLAAQAESKKKRKEESLL